MSNEFAWALALAPLINVLASAALMLTAPRMAGLAPLASLAVWVGLGWADASRVRAAGYRVSRALAILFAPVYLFVRSARTKTTYAIPLVGLGAIVATYLGVGLMPSVVGAPVDGPWTERAIEHWYFEGKAPAGTGADCPDGAVVRTGGTFTCTLETRRRTLLVDVRVNDARTGEIVWDLR